MNAHQASVAWQKRQAKTLKQTYTRAWKAGQANYRAQTTTPPAAAGAQPPPKTPPAQPMQRALGPALQSLARMGAAIGTIVPTAEMVAAAATVEAAIAAAVAAYITANSWRLAGGVSVAWAGEQHGYVQAAAADGLLLDWQLDGGAHHCEDCPALAALPPMALDQWPTLPGEGATECAGGCKCTMRAVAAPVSALTAAHHELLSRIGNRQPALVTA